MDASLKKYMVETIYGALLLGRSHQASEAPSITANFEGLKAHAAREEADKGQPKGANKTPESQSMEASGILEKQNMELWSESGFFQLDKVCQQITTKLFSSDIYARRRMQCRSFWTACFRREESYVG